MPYIMHPSQRALLDSHIIPAAQAAANEGDLNYCLTRLVDQWLVIHGLNYAELNAVIGVLECAKLELYRRVAAPYEDRKIAANGDVYDCIEEGEANDK